MQFTDMHQTYLHADLACSSHSCVTAPQVYVSMHDGHRTKAWRIHLAKGTRSRLQEDVVASRLVCLWPASCFLATPSLALSHNPPQVLDAVTAPR